MKYNIKYCVHINNLTEIIKCYKVLPHKYIPCIYFSNLKIRNLKFFDYGICIEASQYRKYDSFKQAKRYIINQLNYQIKILNRQINYWKIK